MTLPPAGAGSPIFGISTEKSVMLTTNFSYTASVTVTVVEPSAVPGATVTSNTGTVSSAANALRGSCCRHIVSTNRIASAFFIFLLLIFYPPLKKIC